jgi:hypothetical protein
MPSVAWIALKAPAPHRPLLFVRVFSPTKYLNYPWHEPQGRIAGFITGFTLN